MAGDTTEANIVHHPIVPGDTSDEAMDRMRERMAEQPDIDRQSDELGARAADPAEANKRTLGTQGIGGLSDLRGDEDRV